MRSRQRDGGGRVSAGGRRWLASAGLSSAAGFERFEPVDGDPTAPLDQPAQPSREPLPRLKTRRWRGERRCSDDRNDPRDKPSRGVGE
jgi:hypothetical protein